MKKVRINNLLAILAVLFAFVFTGCKNSDVKKQKKQ